MLSGISSPFGSEMQVASVAFYTAAGLLAGRKFCLAAGCKLGGAVAGLMKKQNAAEWNQASAQYLAQAKKDAVRDVAAVAGFVGALALVGYANEVLAKREDESHFFNDKNIKTGLFVTGMVVPSILNRVVSGLLLSCNILNKSIQNSRICAPLNQCVVRPSMYLLQKLNDRYEFRFEGRPFLCLGGEARGGFGGRYNK